MKSPIQSLKKNMFPISTMAISNYILAASEYIEAAKNYKKQLARTICRTPTPPRECNFCYEIKPYTAFPRARNIPKHCRNCIIPEPVACCKDCLKSTLEAQIQSKHPRQIKCPRCNNIWKWMSIMLIFGNSELGKQKRKNYTDRLTAYDGSMERYHPPEDSGTLALLIQQNSRLCPHCARPFQRTEGCGDMWCGNCRGFFMYKSTISVAEAHTAWLERSGRFEKLKRLSYANLRSTLSFSS